MGLAAHGAVPPPGGRGLPHLRLGEVHPRLAGAPGYQDYLSENRVTIAEARRPAGYRTYMAGKWHIGQNKPHWPVARGFDESVAILEGYNYFRPQDAEWARNGEDYTPDSTNSYTTDYLTGQAVEYIRNHEKGWPFFMYLAYTAPH